MKAPIFLLTAAAYTTLTACSPDTPHFRNMPSEPEEGEGLLQVPSPDLNPETEESVNRNHETGRLMDCISEGAYILENPELVAPKNTSGELDSRGEAVIASAADARVLLAEHLASWGTSIEEVAEGLPTIPTTAAMSRGQAAVEPVASNQIVEQVVVVPDHQEDLGPRDILDGSSNEPSVECRRTVYENTGGLTTTSIDLEVLPDDEGEQIPVLVSMEFTQIDGIPEYFRIKLDPGTEQFFNAGEYDLSDAAWATAGWNSNIQNTASLAFGNLPVPYTNVPTTYAKFISTN